MAALTCDLCGGKLFGKPGGMFECDSCGMEYNSDWARAKIQEIRGSVKVEGTVSVKVEGAATAESLIKRARLALEEKKWSEAVKALDEAKNMEPENGEISFGLLLADLKCANEGELREMAEQADLTLNPHYAAARRFAKGAQADFFRWLDSLDPARLDPLAMIPRLEKARKRILPFRKIMHQSSYWSVLIHADCTVEICTRRRSRFDDNPDPGWENVVMVAGAHSRAIALMEDGTAGTIEMKAGAKRIEDKDWTDLVDVCACGDEGYAGLKKDGTVVTMGLPADMAEKAAEWTDVAAIYGYFALVALKKDGTVESCGSNASRCRGWDEIVDIAVGPRQMVGLKRDGTVVANGMNDTGSCDVSDWTDIIAVAAGDQVSLGLRADGKVVSTAYLGSRSCCANEVTGWKDIVAIFAADASWGITKLGNTVSTGYYDSMSLGGKTTTMRSNTQQFTLFKLADNIEKEREAGKKTVTRRRNEAKRKVLEKEREDYCRYVTDYQNRLADREKEKKSVETELAGLKGFFTGKKRKELEEKLAGIERERSSYAKKAAECSARVKELEEQMKGLN